MEETAPHVPLPDPHAYQHLVNLLTAQRAWHRPMVKGRRNISKEKPTIFVINHGILGMEGMMIIAELYRTMNIMARGLTEIKPFKNPAFSAFFKSIGYVPGTREICGILMARGEYLVVAPGGGREVMKNRGEAYQLFWGERTGFVRMAVKYGYTLTPLAVIGPDDAVDVVYEQQEIIDSAFGEWLKKTGIMESFLNDGKYIFPVVKGLGWTPIPRPERIIFRAGEPVETAHLRGNVEDKDLLLEVREEVRARLLLEIEKERKK